MRILDQKSDEELMILYQNDNYDAFEVLYTRHKDRVYSYLDKRLFDKGPLPDLFQNVFTKMHKSRLTYSSKFAFIKWLYVICRSELIDHLRKTKSNLKIFDDQIFASSEPDSMDLVDHHLDSLKGRERSIFELRFKEDKDYDEIAKLLNLSVSNVRQILSRVFKKLRKNHE